MTAKIDTVERICSALQGGNTNKAKQIATNEYPVTPHRLTTRHIDNTERTRIFIRDGFIDRYTGDKLLYPGIIVLLSETMPEQFPYHPNWKMEECHPCYWELWPTIDHVEPIARGGLNDVRNMVSTSMARNSAKANFLLDEIGWQLYPPGDFQQWDGLIHWFVAYTERNSVLQKQARIQKWYKCAKKCLRSCNYK